MLGVHTHKGNYHNSGIFLTKEILERLAEYEQRFVEDHQVKRQIKFPEEIRQLQAAKYKYDIEDLDIPEELIRSRSEGLSGSSDE